jgi:hypothetical protein
VRPALVILASIALPALLAGCGKPSAANIQLRKENQALRDKVAQLERLRQGDRATIAALEGRSTTRPAASWETIEGLFTVHGIKLGRLTGGDDSDPAHPGHEGVRVYLTPQDQHGDDLKAAGSIVVEIFDLAQTDRPLVGRWEFPAEEAAKHWYAAMLMYGYVVECPFDKPPAHPELTVKVSFTDALTGRTFTAQKVVTIELPTSPGIAAQPAGE